MNYTPYVCSVCIEWFSIDASTSLIMPSGVCCDYCTDLTGRPQYVPVIV